MRPIDLDTDDTEVQERQPTRTSGCDEGVDKDLEAAFRKILVCLGESSREGLQMTPARAAKALRFMTSGYGMTLSQASGSALFRVRPNAELSLKANASGARSGLVRVKGIRIFSLCEHHLLPFYGYAHIGYLPGEEVLGLSKLARIAEMYSRRLQMQERLTEEIADAMEAACAPRGVAVALECTHMGMCCRGVRNEASTSTSAMRGDFALDSSPGAKAREEFWRGVCGPASRL